MIQDIENIICFENLEYVLLFGFKNLFFVFTIHDKT